MFKHFMHHEFDPGQHCGPRDRHHARFGGRRGPWDRGFGGGRERFLDPGDLQLIILQLLERKPSYGYELMKSIEERLSGGYAPSPGVIYPTLTLLEERGFALPSAEAGKKVYTITEAGKEELKANATRLGEITDRLEHSGEAFRQGESPDIRRAMGELRRAILLRAVRARDSRERLTPEQKARIVEAIHAAARTIDAV